MFNQSRQKNNSLMKCDKWGAEMATNYPIACLINYWMSTSTAHQYLVLSFLGTSKKLISPSCCLLSQSVAMQRNPVALNRGKLAIVSERYHSRTNRELLTWSTATFSEGANSYLGNNSDSVCLV